MYYIHRRVHKDRESDNVCINLACDGGLIMLFILINWLYVFLTSFSLGYAFSELSGRLFSYRLKHMDSILMTGLVCAAVYAQIFSLFHKVSALTNGILFLFSLAVLLTFREKLRADIKQTWDRTGTLSKILIPILLLVWAFCTSRGYQCPDAASYYAHSIRWIEEYGIVPGQALTGYRFSYNSSSFALSALYSMKFLLGQSMHAMAGWFAFLISITVLDIIKGYKKLRWSDYANAAVIYYLTTIWDEIAAPSSDYITMCVVFFLFIKWIRLLERPKNEQQTAPYALLCVLGVFALTLKITAALVLLLLLKPVCSLLRERRFKEILLYLALGLAIAVPWMCRSVLLSGWLIYPLTLLDFFDLPWKQKTGWIKFDIDCIKGWGKGLSSQQADAPIWEWFGGWFWSVLEAGQKVFVLFSIVSLFLIVPLCIASFIKKRQEDADKLLVLFTISCSYLYWQLSAPLPRYGYAYLLLLPALTFGLIILLFGRDSFVRAALALYGLYKAWKLAIYISSCYLLLPYYIRQVEYDAPQYPVSAIEINGITFYHSEWESLGYEYFPSIPSTYAEIRLRGDSLEDGFELASP